MTYRRERLETPDGDELLLDHLDAPEGASRVLLLHGLEGSSYSSYAQAIALLARSRGLAVTALNFRSCARDPADLARHLPNRRPRLYHSGETTDLDFVVSTLVARERASIGGIGISLGGNVLLKWLGERGDGAPLKAAAAISVPFDLAAGARHLEGAVGRLYVSSFAETLVPKAEDLARRFPEAAARLDLPRARAARTFRQLDDAATAPLHGFADADDYYSRSSSLGFLPKIAVPTLCLSACDDPFQPEEALERARRAASPAVRMVLTPRGGHVGFLEGAPFRLTSWAEKSAVAWLAEALP